jgi:hypothetical protein
MLLSNSQIMLQDLTGFFVPHIFVFSFRNVFFGTGGGQVAKRCWRTCRQLKQRLHPRPHLGWDLTAGQVITWWLNHQTRWLVEWFNGISWWFQGRFMGIFVVRPILIGPVQSPFFFATSHDSWVNCFGHPYLINQGVSVVDVVYTYIIYTHVIIYIHVYIICNIYIVFIELVGWWFQACLFPSTHDHPTWHFFFCIFRQQEDTAIIYLISIYLISMYYLCWIITDILYK